jgi:hypothetical protein
MQEPRDPERGRARDRSDEPIESERYVAGDSPDRAVDREVEYSSRATEREVDRPVRREVERETTVPSDRDYRGVRYGSTGPYPAVELKDLVRWGPIIAGFATTLATLILMSVLGGAIGATTLNQDAAAAQQNAGTFGLIWAALSAILAFFLGGWIAARTAGIGGRMAALVNSGLVWAFTLLFALTIAGLGLAGMGDSLGSVTGLDPSAGAAGTTTAEAMTATWGTLAALVLGLASALVGGLVGMHREPEPYNR